MTGKLLTNKYHLGGLTTARNPGTKFDMPRSTQEPNTADKRKKKEKPKRRSPKSGNHCYQIEFKTVANVEGEGTYTMTTQNIMINPRSLR